MSVNASGCAPKQQTISGGYVFRAENRRQLFSLAFSDARSPKEHLNIQGKFERVAAPIWALSSRDNTEVSGTCGFRGLSGLSVRITARGAR